MPFSSQSMRALPATAAIQVQSRVHSRLQACKTATTTPRSTMATVEPRAVTTRKKAVRFGVGVKIVVESPVEAHDGVARQEVLNEPAEEPQATTCAKQPHREVQPEVLPRRKAPEQPPKLGVVAPPQARHRGVGKQRLAPPHEPRPVVRGPTVGQVEAGRHGDQRGEHQRGPSQPALHEREAAPEEVAHQDHRRGPHSPPQGVVDQEGPPAHPAYACDQGSEDAQAREEACQEYGLAPVPGEERLGAGQPLRGDEEVAAPPQHEGTAPLAADPVAYLVAQNGPKDAERYRVPQVEVPPLDQDARGKEYGLAWQGHPGALQHHSEEDDQVAVLLDEREDPVHSRKV